jgi:ribosomal protein S18 acetylase RimI-like enzyme
LTTAAQGQVRYQQVYQLTPSTLAPYAALTLPSLKPGSNALARLRGELIAVSAMANGEMVALAIAERLPSGGAALRSLCVDPAWRRQGIGTGLIARLMRSIKNDGIGTLSLQYQASELTQLALEPILRRLGWSNPKTDFVLLEGRSEQLAAIDWVDRLPITEPYRILPWHQLSEQQLDQTSTLDAPAVLKPHLVVLLGCRFRAVADHGGVKGAPRPGIRKGDDGGHEGFGRGLPAFGVSVCEN